MSPKFDSKSSFHFEPIGVLNTPFKSKFGIPRQSGLSANALGLIKLNPGVELGFAMRGLELFSHVWVVFVFHDIGYDGVSKETWKPMIRVPRLIDGEKARMGVFATRSPHRPNPIGMSALKIEKLLPDAPGGAEIHVSGVDLLDGTPVLDIKPYVPYADSIPDAKEGWATRPMNLVPVVFSELAERQAAEISSDVYPGLHGGFRALVQELLTLDPRPTSQKKKDPALNDRAECEQTEYGFFLLGYDIRWEVRGDSFYVREISALA